MSISSYKEIIAWQKAHELAKRVYLATKKFPTSEQYGLVSQLRRAAVSVPSNIVEGFTRRGLKDSINFYTYAKASLKEVDYQLLLSYELSFLDEASYMELSPLCEEVSKVLSAWISNHKY